jgi:TP901 family phage tail tape measure protein
MADYRYNLVIGVGISTRDVASGTREIEESFSRTERRALKAVATIEKAFSKLDQVQEKVFNNKNSNGKQWTEQEKAIQKVNRQLDKYDNQLAKLGGYDSELRRLNKLLAQEGLDSQINETTKAFLRQRAALVDEEKAAQNLAKSLAKAQKANYDAQQAKFSKVGNAGQSAQNIGGGIQNAGLALTATITAPIILASKAILRLGTQYEENLNLIQEVTKATGEEMTQLSQKAFELGADMGLPATSAADAAKAMLELAKGGLTAKDAMEAAKGTLQLAAAANIDGAKAAEIQANALNAFCLEAKEAGRVADLLAATANASSVEITDIALSLGQVSATAAAAKIPIEDVATAIGLLGNAGLKGSDAGTSLKTFLSSLTNPRNADAVDSLKQLGVEVYDLQGKFVGMPSIIKQFQTGLEGLTDAQKQQALYTIFGSDATRAANILFKTNSDTVNAATDAWDEMSLAVQRSNAAADLAQARTKGLGGAWAAVKSQLETFGLSIYLSVKQPLTEMLIFIALFVSKFIDAFTNLPESAKQFIVALIAVAAAVGPVLLVVGSLVVGIGSLISTIAAGAAAVGGFAILGGIIAGVVVAIGLLTVGVTAAIAVVYGLVDAWENGFGPVASVVAIAVGAILTAFVPILGLPILIAAVLTTIYEIWTTNFAGLRDATIQVWNAIVEVINAAMAEIVGFVNEQGAEIIAWWNENYPLIQETFAKVSAQISITVQQFLASVYEFWQNHGEQIKAVVSATWNIIKTVVSAGIRIALGIIKIAMQIFNGDWSGAWQTFKTILQTAVTAAFAILKSLGQIVLSSLKFIVTAIINTATSVFNSSLEIGRNIIQGLINGIKNGAGFVSDAIGSMVSNAVSKAKNELGIQSPSRVFFEIGDFVMQGFADGITANDGKVSKAIQTSINKRVTELKKSLFSTNNENSALLGTNENEFKLRFNLLNAEEAKGKIEDLIKLRVELGTNFDKPLPNTFSAISRELENLSLQKDGLKEATDLFKEFDEILSNKLPNDATNIEKVNFLLSDTNRSKGIDDTTKAMLRLNAVAADMKISAEAINDEFDKLSNRNAGNIKGLKEDLKLFGIDDPVKRRAIEFSFEDLSQYSDAQKQIIRDQQGYELGQIAELDAMKKQAEASKNYAETLKSLQEALRGNVELTQRQKIENEILNGSLQNLNQTQQERLLQLADQVDIEKQFAPIREKLNRYSEDFADILTRGFTNGFSTFGKDFKSFFAGIWKDVLGGITSQISNGIKGLLGNLLNGIFKSKTGGSQSSGTGGGGIIGTILGGLFGKKRSTGGASSGGTGSFNPLAPNSNGSFNAAGFNQTFGGGAGGFNNFGLPILNNPVSRPQINLGAIFQNPAQRAFGKLGGFFGKSGAGGGLSALAPLLGGKLGGRIGGGLGSVAGGALGLSAFAALNPALLASALPFGASSGAIIGLLSNPFTIAAGAALLVGSYFLKRNSQRKKDEKTRNQLSLDAFASMDKLIADVNSNKLDGVSALSQADEIRKNYLTQAGQIKDKKTRNHAIADVSRIDAKIGILKSAIKKQAIRKEKFESSVPTFKLGGPINDGGAVSNFIGKNYQNNPLGYIQGPGTSRSDSIRAYFSRSKSFADISNHEYVLDAETTSRIGVRALDKIRKNKGRDFYRILMGEKQIARLADGGPVNANSSFTPSSSAGIGSLENVKIENNITLNMSPNGEVESVDVESYLNSREGKKIIIATVRKHVQTQGEGDGLARDIKQING